jgi:hypothetical protein
LLGEGNLYANSKTAAASVIKKAKMNEWKNELVACILTDIKIFLVPYHIEPIGALNMIPNIKDGCNS